MQNKKKGKTANNPKKHTFGKPLSFKGGKQFSQKFNPVQFKTQHKG
jgi:hypothetical protein